MPLPPKEDIIRDMGWQRWQDDGKGNLTKIKGFKLYTRYDGRHIRSVYTKLKKKDFVAWLEKRDPEEIIWITGFRTICPISKFLNEKLDQHVETFLPKMWVHDKWYRTPGWAHQFLLKVLLEYKKDITVKNCLEALDN